MDSEYDPADPEAAIREMMGFSSFNKVARGTGEDKDMSTSAKPSGANTEPVQSRLAGQGPTTYYSQDVRFSLDSTKSSTSRYASAPRFAHNIPASFTPASVLPASLPPRPPTGHQTIPPPYDPDPTPSDPNLAGLVHFPATTYSPAFTQPPDPDWFTGPTPFRSSSTFTPSDIRYSCDPNAPYTPFYLSDGTINPNNTNPRPAVRVNERGDPVYFQPSFVDPDPWRYAREAKEAKKVGGARTDRDDGGRRGGNRGGRGRGRP